jgi:hypothetical protein
MSEITLAVSAKAAVELFNTLQSTFTFSKSDSANFGPFSASYSLAVHLQNGSFTLNNGGTVEVQHMQVVWDTLKAQVCFNLPGFCIGGFCIIPNPFGGCIVSLPKFCIGGPICIGPDLSGLVSDVVDFQSGILPLYYVDPQRAPGITDLAAEFAGHSNQWKIFLNPTNVAVDPVDIPATIENLIENLIKNAIENAFSFIPSWAFDLLFDLLGPLLDLFSSLLGIVGPINDWLENLLFNQFGILTALETAIADYFASQHPIWQFEDPYPILPASNGLIPVKIPVRSLAVTIDASEMVVSADIGP